MRVHPRQQAVSIAQTELDIKLHRWQWPRDEGQDPEAEDPRDIDDVVMLRLVTLEIRAILLDMEPKVKRTDNVSSMKDMIREHQKETGLTDVELLQGLFSYCSSKMKYMLRYERHGDYDKPGGLE